MRAVNIVTQTNGIGFWTGIRKKVNIHSIEVDDGEMRAYFNVKDWDDSQHGLIYTDEGWLDSFKTGLVSLGVSAKMVDYIGYSEYGMQGEDYVSLDVPLDFELP